MNTEDNVLHSLLDGLSKDDQISILRSIQDNRDLQLEQKRHPRRRRQRNENGILEPLPRQARAPEQDAPAEFALASASAQASASGQPSTSAQTGVDRRGR